MILIGTHVVLTSENKPCFGPLDNIYPVFEEFGITYQIQKEVLSMNPIRIVIKILKILVLIFNNPSAKAFIGADPINAFAGILGKHLFNKQLKVIFYSIDYSTKRSGNLFLDWIYIKLDEFDAKYSDETWSCSSKVVRLRSSYLKKEKNIFFPNTPSFSILEIPKYDKFTLLFIGYLNSTYYLSWLEKIMDLVSQNNSLQLIIIGNGENSDHIHQKQMELKYPKNISILGFLPREKVIEYLSKSHVGLSLYSGTNNYDEFRDSMKVREYTHSLLPTITTGIISNAWEVEEHKLGIVVHNYEEVIQAIEHLLDFKNYNLYQKNCENYKKNFVVKDFLKKRLM